MTTGTVKKLATLPTVACLSVADSCLPTGDLALRNTPSYYRRELRYAVGGIPGERGVGSLPRRKKAIPYAPLGLDVAGTLRIIAQLLA